MDNPLNVIAEIVLAGIGGSLSAVIVAVVYEVIRVRLTDKARWHTELDKFRRDGFKKAVKHLLFVT